MPPQRAPSSTKSIKVACPGPTAAAPQEPGSIATVANVCDNASLKTTAEPNHAMVSL
jgi:hypothetical protein